MQLHTLSSVMSRTAVPFPRCGIRYLSTVSSCKRVGLRQRKAIGCHWRTAPPAAFRRGGGPVQRAHAPWTLTPVLTVHGFFPKICRMAWLGDPSSLSVPGQGRPKVHHISAAAEVAGTDAVQLEVAALSSLPVSWPG